MNMRLIIETADIVGKVLVSYTALAVHYRVRHERKIDDKVFSIMRKENLLGIVGIAFMVAAYLLEVIVEL